MRHGVRSAVFIAVAAALATGIRCEAAPLTSQMQFDIYKFPQTDGSTQYHLTVVFGQPQSTIHFPSGVSKPGASFDDFTFNSFADLLSATEGNWSITYPAVPVFSQPAETLSFTVANFPESLLSSPPPTITSPPDGSTVGSQFPLTWDWPQGVVPPSDVSIYRHFLGPENQTLTTFGTFSTVGSSYNETSSFPNYGTPDQLVLRVGTAENTLAPYISAVVSDQSPPQHAVDVVSTVSSYSLPVEVAVRVPEPGTAILALVGMLGCVCGRHRYQRL